LDGRRDSRDSAAQDAIAKCIGTALEADGVAEPDNLRLHLLYYLFPKLEGVFGRTHYGSEWNTRWAREQRICSERYFRRFFTYGIPVDDVADAEVIRLETVTNSEEQISGMLQEFAGKGLMRPVIEKLRGREAEIPMEVIPSLATAIAYHSNLLPREHEPLVGQWTISQAGILVANLIKRLPLSAPREQLTRELVQSAEPLTFAVECLRWIGLPKDGAEADRIVSKVLEDELNRLVVDRIRAQADRNPTYREFPSEAPHLLWLWHEFGSREELSNYLRHRFKVHNDEVYEFISTYLGTSWGGDGVSRPGDLVRESYNGIAELVDPSFIVLKLRERYGAELDNPEFRHLDDWPIPRRIAHQFAFLHNVAEQEKSARAAAAALSTPDTVERPAPGHTLA
jgi:hypothetical protein